MALVASSIVTTRSSSGPCGSHACFEPSWKRSVLEEKRPGREASWKRSVLEEKRPGREASWKRSVLEEKRPGREASWKRSVLEEKHAWQRPARPLLAVGRAPRRLADEPP